MSDDESKGSDSLDEDEAIGRGIEFQIWKIPSAYAEIGQHANLRGCYPPIKSQKQAGPSDLGPWTLTKIGLRKWG